MLKATSSIITDYNSIKSFLLDNMKPTPNSRALSTYLFLTASRIHEALPWNYTSKFTSFKKQVALFLHELTIGEVSKGSGIYYIHVPYVLKRQGVSGKSKEEQKGRTILIDDLELLNVFLDYLTSWRPSWRGELLEKTYFNPAKKSYYDLLETISAMTDNNHLSKIIAKNYGVFSKNRKKWAEHNRWLFENKYKNKPLAEQLVFPFSVKSYREAMNAAGYKISGMLYDIKTGAFQEGKRAIYTHFWREARINTMYYELGFTLEEVVYQLGWREMGSIQYYFRKNELLLRSAFQKMLDKKVQKDKEESKAYTVDKLIQKRQD